jgi:hypothetical protein
MSYPAPVVGPRAAVEALGLFVGQCSQRETGDSSEEDEESHFALLAGSPAVPRSEAAIYTRNQNADRSIRDEGEGMKGA